MNNRYKLAHRRKPENLSKKVQNGESVSVCLPESAGFQAAFNNQGSVNAARMAALPGVSRLPPSAQSPAIPAAKAESPGSAGFQPASTKRSSNNHSKLTYWKKFSAAGMLLLSAALFCLLVQAPALAQAAPNANHTQFVYPVCTKRMSHYFMIRTALMIAVPLSSSAFLLALLQSGMLGKLRNHLSKTRNYLTTLIVLASSIYLLVSLFKFPIDWYSSFFLEHQFALSSQSIASWLRDKCNHILVGALFVPLFTICFLIIHKKKRGMFLPVWLFLSAVMLAIAFLEPLAVQPMFNKFRPLEESSLKTGIESLCRKSGIAQPVILVADKSKQTSKLNAYVSGYSATKRIVLYDNLVKTVPEDEVLAVVAHELGHYRLKHVTTGLVLAIISILPLLYLAELNIDKFLPHLPRKWDIKTNSDPVLIAVWCIVIWTAPLVISPLVSSISRLFEAEADSYAIRLTANPLAAARMFRTLSEHNLSHPDPPQFIEFWFYSHPSLKHRIDYALKQSYESAKTHWNSTEPPRERQLPAGTNRSVLIQQRRGH